MEDWVVGGLSQLQKLLSHYFIIIIKSVNNVGQIEPLRTHSHIGEGSLIYSVIQKDRSDAGCAGAWLRRGDLFRQAWLCDELPRASELGPVRLRRTLQRLFERC